MNCSYRPLTVEDAARLDRMMPAIFDERFGEGWTGDQVVASLASAVRCWGELLRVDGQTAGFSLTRQVADEAELLLVGVVPSLRSSGLGRALILRAIADAEMKNARTLHLEVRENNDVARRIYESLGFEIIGRRKSYYGGVDGTRHDAVTMQVLLQNENSELGS